MTRNTLETVRAYYRENPGMVSSPFGGVSGLDEPSLAGVMDRLGVDLAGRDVLDVGCGRGFFADFARARGARYFGVDLDVGYAVAARDRLAAASGTHLPFCSGSFDWVVCMDSFEHFPDIPAAAAEFGRVLRDEGSVFLSVPNYANGAGLVKLLLERTGLRDRDTWAPFGGWKPQACEAFVTPGRIRRVFRGGGFRRFKRLALPREVWAGLFPVLWHGRFPETPRLILETRTGALQRLLARFLPWSSLHHFWRIDRSGDAGARP